jgi:hypothetical protein
MAFDPDDAEFQKLQQLQEKEGDNREFLVGSSWNAFGKRRKRYYHPACDQRACPMWGVKLKKVYSSTKWFSRPGLRFLTNIPQKSRC